jgi:endo-alpha-1,4-polygalactosaminidase (GH114 family)
MKIRKTLFFCMTIILVFFVVKGTINMLWYGPMYDIKSFTIFYGIPDKQKLTNLLEKDAVIIEPSAFTKEDVESLKKSDVKVFGYVSLMQLENWNLELKKHILPSDYARLNDERIYIREWDTYVMDPREKHYREVLLWKINKYIIDRGFDGVFFDTVDDLDYHFIEQKDVQNSMRLSYVSLLEEVKTVKPDLLVLQNRGFDTLKSTSHPYIDGILWEGFDAKDIKGSEWAQTWLKYLRKQQWLGRTRVFSVVSDEESFQLSNKYGFPPFFRQGNTYQE